MPQGLHMENLCARLGFFRLGPLSLTLAAGEYLVLLGPSGCGKTSLLRTLCGLQPAASGTIHLDGRDITGWPPEKRRIGYVPQTSDLFPHLNVAGNISFGLRRDRRPAAVRREPFNRIVELLELGPLLERQVSHLSGGESRRVALARGLAIEPRLLLLDEPLSMLDPNARAGMLRVIARLHDELGATAIHVTHDRDEAWTMPASCGVMQAGRIEQTGPARDIFHAPATRFTAEFTGAGNILRVIFKTASAGLTACAGPCAWPIDALPNDHEGWVLLRPETLLPHPVPGIPPIDGLIERVQRRGVFNDLLVRTAALGVLRAHWPAGLHAASGNQVKLYLSAPPHVLKDSPHDGR